MLALGIEMLATAYCQISVSRLNTLSLDKCIFITLKTVYFKQIIPCPGIAMNVKWSLESFIKP